MKQVSINTRASIALALAVALCALCLGVASPAATDKAYADDAYDAGAAELSAQAADSANTPSRKQRKTFKKAAADFSIELFQRSVAAGNDNENITVSPLSVMTALTVTANGAAGKTSAQMREVLGDGMSMKQLNSVLSWFNKKHSDTKKVRLSNANSVWYDNDGSLHVKKKFLKTNKTYHNAEVVSTDFKNAQTVDDINGWVAEKTNNMIKRVISQLEENTRLMIINALYFEAKWRNGFEKNAVRDATFTTANGKKNTVDMMYGEESRYIEGVGVCGFVKPYAKDYSYVALLPDEGTSLQDYVTTLDGTTFRKLVKNASRAEVRIALPKYTVEYTNEAMQRQLIDMGMSDAFSYDADLSKMGTVEDGNLYLDSVIHKTKVEVDESGTKAAAVTGVVVGNTTSVGPSRVKSVILDRPFVYAIVDNATSLPIFIGTVNTL